MPGEGENLEGQLEGQSLEGQQKDQLGSEDRSWIPKEYEAEPSLKAIKDVPSLTKGYVEAQKMIGGSVRVPKEDAAQEEWDAFYAKMGRPEKPEDYGFTKPDTLPEGVQWNENLMGWFGKAAHDAGLSKAQASRLMDAWNQNAFSEAHSNQKAMKAELGKLQEDWGDRFNGRVELGLRGVERLLPEEEATQFKALMDQTGLGNHPLMLKFAYQVGNMLKEDGYILSDSHGGILSPDSAKAKIAEINKNLKHPYWVPDNPGHAEAVQEMTQLFKLASRK